MLFGSDQSLSQSVTLLLTAITVTAVLLLSLAPILLFFLLTSSHYQFFKLLNVACCTAAGSMGVVFLGQGMRLALVVVALVVVFNVPLNRSGLNLAHLATSSASLIIRDGLVLKGSGPEIYVLEDNKLRWIKDIPTLTAEGYVWGDVQFVDCDYLRSLPDGPPIPEDAGPAPQP